MHKHRGMYKQIGTVVDDITRDKALRKPPSFVLASANCSCGATGVIGRKAERTNIVKVGRNDECPCGSKKKYKKCCMLNELGSLGDPIPCKCIITSEVNVGFLDFK